MGKSDNPMKRYQEHLSGSGSAWTRKYKPVGIEKIVERASPFDEDKWVKIYMEKHGIDKVRGGAYVLEELPEYQEEALKTEIWGAKDKCTTCGRSGHWAKDCYAKNDITGKELKEESEDEIIICRDCDKEFSTESEFNRHKCHSPSKKGRGVCYRCGRPGHYSPDCYAKTHKNGYDLESEEDEYNSD